jgi:hypothetical protein
MVCENQQRAAGMLLQICTIPSTISYAGIIRFRYLGMISAQQTVEHPLVKVVGKGRGIF